MDWHTMSPELVDWPGKITANLKLIEEASAPEKLISGEVAMMIHPHPTAKLLEATKGGKVHRLFPEKRIECTRYFKKYGDYPIMHLLVFSETIAKNFQSCPLL